MLEWLTQDLSEFTAFILFWLFVAAVIAGYIDTLVGGGGLITIPALLFAGVPPLQALGTNKLQASAGTGTATLTLIAKKSLRFSNVKWLMLMAFFGAILGAVAVQYVDAEVLRFVIPGVILLISLYFLMAPKQNVIGGNAKVSKQIYQLTAVPSIGFYDGMFGPATGSFFVLAGVSLRGQNIVNASIVAKSLNFATNVASLLVFFWFGQVAIALGIVMMFGQFVGASFGARALIKINPDRLRYLVVAMCLIILFMWFFKQ